MFLGRSRQVKLNDKNYGKISAEYIKLTNKLLAEHTWGDPGKQKLDVKIKHP
jgi:hypothetical protein